MIMVQCEFKKSPACSSLTAQIATKSSWFQVDSQTHEGTTHTADSEVVCFCVSRTGDEDPRSAGQGLGAELAEAAAYGGVWRRRHDPHSPAEASCTAAAGPR